METDERCPHYRFTRRSPWYETTVPEKSALACHAVLIGPEGCPKCLADRLLAARDAACVLVFAIFEARTMEGWMALRPLAEEVLHRVYDDASKWMDPYGPMSGARERFDAQGPKAKGDTTHG